MKVNTVRVIVALTVAFVIVTALVFKGDVKATVRFLGAAISLEATQKK